MAKIVMLAGVAMIASTLSLVAQPEFEKDVIKTSGGDLTITFIGHGTLMFRYAGKTFHVDPYSQLADYGKLPKADVLLITHQHGDHLDPVAIEKIRTNSTVVFLTQACTEKVKGGKVMRAGEVQNVYGVTITAVPAYNLVQKAEGGRVFHPKGEGIGYILLFGDTRVYVAGDTENTPEMKALKNIDIAFLPMNLPYTMTPEMVADAAKAFKPKILYPYHYGQTDPKKLVEFLKEEKGIEVRIRKMM
jgi:L-ascorbate metabolism protein UlaG (beta-lactamase superfamily)